MIVPPTPAKDVWAEEEDEVVVELEDDPLTHVRRSLWVRLSFDPDASGAAADADCITAVGPHLGQVHLN